jgi:hypothetical protein
MAVAYYIKRVLGFPADFDVDAVTSVLKGRDLQTRTADFRGFDSPPGRF